MNRIEQMKLTGIKTLTAILCTALLSACGGGGGSDAGSPVTGNPAPSQPPSSGTTVTGAVTKGPVAGASLEFFELDDFGFGVGTPVATATTDDNGNYTATVPAESGALLVVARGGSFVDESDQESDVNLKRKIQLTNNDFFLSVLPAGSTSAAITPFTDVLVERSRVMASAEGGFLSQFTDAKAILDAQAGFDLVTTIPANPISPAASASEAQKQYALLLGGLANAINNVAIQLGLAAPTYEVVVAVSFDLVDGLLDGQQFGQPQQIFLEASSGSDVGTNLPANVDLDAEINRFRNNNANSYTDVALPTIEVTSLGNTPPTASAGADLSVARSALVTLDGSGSADAESGLFYNWVQTGGATVSFSNSAQSPTFTAPDLLVGNDTLTFELTVTDPVGASATDAVTVNVAGAIPTTFEVVDQSELGDGIGVDLEGGGKFILNPDGSGVLFADLGEETFTYTTAGDVLTVVPVDFDIDEFDEFVDADGDGFQEQFNVTETVDEFQLTLLEDLPNGDRFQVRESGTRSFVGVDTTLTLPNEPYEFTFEVRAFDFGQLVPFQVTGETSRSLPYNLIPHFGENLFEQERLELDLFDFQADGTGTTRFTNTSFTWTEAPDGSLTVTFADGEAAQYYLLASRSRGDIVAVDYTLATPFANQTFLALNDVALSFEQDKTDPLPEIRDDVAGIYSGQIFDEEFDALGLSLRLHPDGTGTLEFDIGANNAGVPGPNSIISISSSFGACWDVSTEGEVVVKRARSRDLIPNTDFDSVTTQDFCANLLDENVGFQFELTQLDVEGNLYRHIDLRRDNFCLQGGSSDPDCTGSLDVSGINYRLTEREPLTAVPPIAVTDVLEPPPETTVTLDLLANDVLGDLALDAASAVLTVQPVNGTASISGGVLTYTSNTGADFDVMQYRVRDVQGNLSTAGTIRVTVNPCATINGVRGRVDVETGDCFYESQLGFANPVTIDLTLAALPNSAAHIFNDSLVVGQQFFSDADITAAGITQGGDGPTLTVEAGTIVAFSFAQSGLVINRGAQLQAAGTPTAPIVFTASEVVFHERGVQNGQPVFLKPQDTDKWSGIDINGFGVTNQCTYTGSVSGGDLATTECHATSDIGVPFGGQNNADNSGTLQYVQILHSGGFGSIDNEALAGVSFNGVGTGTIVDHLQTYVGQSGIRTLGGAVNMSEVLVMYQRQFGLDLLDGYSGTIERALVIQDSGSGENCLLGEGVFLDNPTQAQIDALQAQGINGTPTVRSMTCIASGDEFGDGVVFDSGVTPILENSLVILPGFDRASFPNACITALSDTAADFDGVSANIFACPDKTRGGSFPTEGISEEAAFSVSNQFATITEGQTNLPPVVEAATGQVLLQGSPLIYSVATADIQVDGAPATVSPKNGAPVFGAVVESDDWTNGWTFGLHGPGPEKLWYEPPILVAPQFQGAERGDTVTLDASQSLSFDTITSFQWTQVGGDPLTLSDATSSAPSFTVPDLGSLRASGFADFELVITDSSGRTASRRVNVFLQPILADKLFTAEELSVPFQFGQDVVGGEFIELNFDGTGTLINSDGEGFFNFTDTGTQLILDFTPFGGKPGDTVTSFIDVDADPTTQEEVQITEFINTITYTLVNNTSDRDRFSRVADGTRQQFDVTNGVALPDEPTSDIANELAVYDLNRVGPLFPVGTEQRTLLANVSTGTPTILDAPRLTVDELTFNPDGTGTSALKGQNFSWFVDFESAPSKLEVNFNDGEFAKYFLLNTRDTGDVVGAEYTYADGTRRVAAALSFRNNPATNWPTPDPAAAGIYETTEAFTLDDDSQVARPLIYRLHPDGTGQLELTFSDSTTGAITDYFVSSNGICWQVDTNGDLQFNRGRALDQRFSGSRIPSPSHCAASLGGDNTLVSFKRINRLYDIDGSARLRSFAVNFSNTCNPTCSADPIPTNSTFQRIFNPVVPFNGNPPLAVDDPVAVTAGVLTPINILGNDFDGDAIIDPTTVLIEVQPVDGTVTVNATTGELEYTGNVGATNDKIFYRVLDANGNLSTIGKVSITINP